jgi:hypothetical protein
MAKETGGRDGYGRGRFIVLAGHREETDSTSYYQDRGSGCGHQRSTAFQSYDDSKQIRRSVGLTGLGSQPRCRWERKEGEQCDQSAHNFDNRRKHDDCLPPFSSPDLHESLRESKLTSFPSFRSWAEPVPEVVSPRSESNSWTTLRDPSSETSRAPSRLTTSWPCWNLNEKLGTFLFTGEDGSGQARGV